MRQVPIIDATGIKTIEEVFKSVRAKGTVLVLSEVNSKQVFDQLVESKLVEKIGKENLAEHFEEALERAKTLH